MYEAFSVILSALLLGITVGLVVAITVTAQMYLFIELPFSLAVSILSMTFNLVPNSSILHNGRNVPSDNLHSSLHTSDRSE
jgi:Mg/Co/Ni transporter MgtE